MITELSMPWHVVGIVKSIRMLVADLLLLMCLIIFSNK
jgi:hypothetical protein